MRSEEKKNQPDVTVCFIAFKIRSKRAEMSVEGSCCGLNSGTIAALALRNSGKLKMTLEQPASRLQTMAFKMCITNANHSSILLVEKLKHVQLLTKYIAFYRNQTLISVDTTAYQSLTPAN